MPRTSNRTLDEYTSYDQNWNQKAGIVQIDESLKKTKEFLRFKVKDVQTDYYLN
jgi:hypothetical protein